MSSISSTEAAVSQLAAQADAVGRLAKDAGGFAAVVAAYESEDAEAFRWVLERLQFSPDCELICEWLRIKLCVIRCLEVCGPVRPEEELPDLAYFARAIVELAADEKRLRRVVDAVACGAAEEYHAVLAELELERYCHLLCRWVCAVIYRRFCEVVCSRGPVFITDPAADIRAAAKVVERAIAHGKVLQILGEAVRDLDCLKVQSVINEANLSNDCEIICLVFCVWRNAWVCRELCERRSPVIGRAYAIEEARNFALATRVLASQPRALADLVSAVESRDAKAYSAIVDRYGLGEYCLQLCSWVSSIVCSEFCFCVCPPVGLAPVFFKIGAIEYATSVDCTLPAGTGLTVMSQQPYAFFSNLRLNGVLPQTFNGKALEYTFEYRQIPAASTTLNGGISAADLSVTVASSAGFPASGPFNVVIGSVNGGYEILKVTNVAGNTWTVVRGQQGTLAAAAPGGAAVVTGVVPASTTWTQVLLGALTVPTIIGYFDNGLDPNPPHLPLIQNCAVYGLTTPGDFAVSVTPDGWVQVPQQSNFSSSGDMLRLASAALAAFAPADQTGVIAGATAVNRPSDLYFGLRMRIRQAGSSTDSDGGTCNIVAIDNSLYNNINHHPEWGGSVGQGQYGVCMVDIPELYVTISTTLAAAITAADTSITVASSTGFPTSGSFNVEIGTEIMTVTNVSGNTWTVVRGQKGTTAAAAPNGAEVVPEYCNDITDSLTVNFTASHPNLGPVSLTMSGPAGLDAYPFTLAPTTPPVTGDWYGAGVPSGWTVANLEPCAYVVQLSVDILLTTGDGNFGPPLYDFISFCKS